MLSMALVSPMGCSPTITLHVLFILLSILLNQDLHLHARDDTDERALSEFKKTIEDSENVLSNWNHSTQVCRWVGVGCNWQGRVIRINLSNSSLNGTLSPFLSNISQLQALDLSSNSLRGPIPGELGSLSHLIQLNLGGNNLQSGIPGSFGMLTNLEHVNLSFNKLDGNLPNAIFCNCTRLEEIDLSNNSLDGSIPPQIGTYLKGLKTLVLINNILTGSIPRSLSNLSQLNVLDLSYNFLHGSIPSELGSLSGLTLLSLSSNNLNDKIPDSFGLLANLTLLNLYSNKLNGNLPTSIVYNCTQLKILNLAHNFLNGSIPPQIGTYPKGLKEIFLHKNNFTGSIPASLSNLSQLSYLDLSSNSLQEFIPVELGELSNLTRLDLSNNRLQNGIPDSFGMLANLEYLDLSDNQLYGKLPTSIFHNCTKLETLDLANNSLDGTIPQIGNLNRLKEIILQMNHLTGVIPVSLSNATAIMIIDLDFNKLIGQLPSDIVVHLSSLEILYINNNSFSSDGQGKDLGHFFRAISNLTYLEQLGIGGNDLSGTLPSTIGLLRRLSIMFLQKNRIHGMIPSNISNLQSLTLLNLEDNFLEGTVPLELFHLPKLERVWLNDNMLCGEIPSIPNVSTHLGVLDLSHNNISGSIPSSISNLTSMRSLALSENFLNGSIPPSLGSMKLEFLNLSHNRLTGKLPADVASMSTINDVFDLSNNLLEGELPWGFSKMIMVLAIVLSSNKFSSKIPPDLGNCITLEKLNLSHNSFQESIPESFGNLKNLASLDLSWNNLSGTVPASLVQCTELKQLNLSFNQLTGALPHGGVFDSLSFESLEGNHFCGSEGFPRCDSRKRQVVLIAIIILSVLFFLAFFCITAAKIIRCTALDVSQHSIDLFSSHPRITYRELSEATGGFDQSRLIGSGGFGHVYRGILSDGSLVAIKVLHLQDHNSSRTFNRECQVLKRIRHRNLMCIITACSLPDFKALVLPFMSKGSLEDHLHPQGDQTGSQLSLSERVSICSDVAEGMTYLHHHAPVQVIHCDLKPSNILLSDDMTAIVSDFGIARLVGRTAEGTALSNTMVSSTTNLLLGSVGYVAPEYGYGTRASTKGDVYSFGIIVLEIVTGNRPTHEMFDSGLSLINWVKYQYRSQLEKIMDSSLLREVREQIPQVRKLLEVAIVELIELGLVCTQEAASARPTMTSIADDLNKLKQYLGGDTTATFTSSQGTSSANYIGDDW